MVDYPGHLARMEDARENGHVRKFTWQELSKLNQRHNAHVAVRGKVYDVSGFVAKHPGGAEQLLLGAGRDITALFESYHDFSVYKVLEKYHVGELISNEMPVFPEPSEFYRTVKERVNAFFKDNHIDRKVCYWVFLRIAVSILFTNICWIGTIYFHNSLVLSLLLATGWGFSLAMIFMTMSHDVGHFAVTHKPWVWKALGAINDCFSGGALLVWIYQHVIGHHSYTNIDRVDPDVFTESDPPDIRRIHTSQKWLRRYTYQHIYLPFLYCLIGMKKRILDYFILYSHRNLSVRLNPLTNSQLAIIILGKCFFFAYYLILPCLYMHWAKVLLLILVGDFVCWYWVVLNTQLTHVSTDVIWPKPDERNHVSIDWAELQVATTLDFATDSWFWTVFSGGLNHQMAHHLLPDIIQSHYPKITPIIWQTCKEFGIKFQHVSTAREAWQLHLEFLRQRGQREGEEE